MRIPLQMPTPHSAILNMISFPKCIPIPVYEKFIFRCPFDYSCYVYRNSIYLPLTSPLPLTRAPDQIAILAFPRIFLSKRLYTDILHQFCSWSPFDHNALQVKVYPLHICKVDLSQSSIVLPVLQIEGWTLRCMNDNSLKNTLDRKWCALESWR